MGPEAVVPRIDRRGSRGVVDDASWSRVPVLALRRAQDGADPVQPTRVRIAYDSVGLVVRFDCDDRDIWATHARRDAPLWEEEVVELFVAPGEPDPTEYVEIEVNPLGAIFDAHVTNPHGRRDSMRVDARWNAAGLVAAVSRPSPGKWLADIEITPIRPENSIFFFCDVWIKLVERCQLCILPQVFDQGRSKKFARFL